MCYCCWQGLVRLAVFIRYLRSHKLQLYYYQNQRLKKTSLQWFIHRWYTSYFQCLRQHLLPLVAEVQLVMAYVPTLICAARRGGESHQKLCIHTKVVTTSWFSLTFALLSIDVFFNRWCGRSREHCAGNPPPEPTPAAPTPPTASPPTSEHDSRLIAYLGNWQSCPTTNQVAPYTHIVIAFAVSYTFNPTKNECSTACDIAEPAICSNSPNPGLVSEWQRAGKKVILSFGGKFLCPLWCGRLCSWYNTNHYYFNSYANFSNVVHIQEPGWEEAGMVM